MTISAGSILRVACRLSFNGVSDVVNVHHLNVTNLGTSSGTEALVLADVSQRMALAYATIASTISNNMQAVDVSTFNISSGAAYGAGTWHSAFTGGTGTGEMLPIGVAALVLWRTFAPKVIGKSYLPPFTEAAQNSDGWVAGTFTAVNNFIGNWFSTPALTNGCVFTKIVYSRSGGLSTTIQSGQLQLRPAYQRRRKVGIGS